MDHAEKRARIALYLALPPTPCGMWPTGLLDSLIKVEEREGPEALMRGITALITPPQKTVEQRLNDIENKIDRLLKAPR